MRSASLLQLLAALSVVFFASGGRAAAGEEAAWQLGRSDFLRYDRFQITVKGGKESRSAATLVTVHGHDLRDDGQYSPAAPVLGDLYQLLALRLPAPGAKSTNVKLDWKPRSTTSLRIKGSVAVTETGPRLIKLEGTYHFKSRGRASRKDRYWIDQGEARSEIEFDFFKGVVRTARIEAAYRREDAKQTGPGSVLKIKRTYELRLQAIERMRPKDFQARVDKAIDNGLKHLRSLQKAEGTFKPHGNWALGTTALAVLTLAACGVPNTDPCMVKAIDWIFTQEPTRTYEQAVCLMAIDRAYTPKEELDLAARGKPVTSFKRDLPPKRMAWCRRVADKLERGATSPGSWGYPPKGTVFLRFDTSNTQYAVLGLRAAVHLGHEVRENTWLGIVRHCKIVMERKGEKGAVSLIRKGEAVPSEAEAARQNEKAVAKVAGFRYSTLESHSHVSAAMTCAAVTCLLIARHHLGLTKSKRLNQKLKKEIEEMLLCGWAWLDQNWAMDRHPRHPRGGWYYYYLYSLERAGVLDAVKRVGGKDWYYEGAMQLLARQGEKGAWNHKGKNATPPTCFALLFLKRGTSPLVTPVTGK